MDKKTMAIGRNTQGIPYLLERSDEWISSGSSTIIRDKNDNKKYGIQVGKDLKCYGDRLVLVKRGDVVIRVYKEKETANQECEIYKIKRFHQRYAELQKIASFKDGKWDNEEVAKKYRKGIQIAIHKATF